MYITIGSILGWLAVLGVVTLLIAKWKNVSANLDEKAATAKRGYYGGRPKSPLWYHWMVLRGLVFTNPKAGYHSDEWTPSKVESDGERAGSAFLLAMFLSFMLIVLKFAMFLIWPIFIIFVGVLFVMKKGFLDSPNKGV